MPVRAEFVGQEHGDVCQGVDQGHTARGVVTAVERDVDGGPLGSWFEAVEELRSGGAARDGLALNAVVWWNTLYLDAAVKQIRADGFPATDDMCARISPIAYEHINSWAATPSLAPRRAPACGPSRTPPKKGAPPAPDGSINTMRWWRRRPARPADIDPELAGIRQELVWKFGEEIAYAIRLTAKDATLIWGPTWEPLPVGDALQQIDAILSERFSLLTPIRVGVQPTANGRWLVYTPDEHPLTSSTSQTRGLSSNRTASGVSEL